MGLGSKVIRIVGKRAVLGLGQAALKGAAAEAGVGVVHAGLRLWRGEIGRRAVVRHVVFEAGSGAVSAAAGAGVAGLVGLGPVGWAAGAAAGASVTFGLDAARRRRRAWGP